MTSQQADQIRELVDRAGWQAVREHEVLGPILAQAQQQMNRERAAMIEPEYECHSGPYSM